MFKKISKPFLWPVEDLLQFEKFLSNSIDMVKILHDVSEKEKKLNSRMVHQRFSTILNYCPTLEIIIKEAISPKMCWTKYNFIRVNFVCHILNSKERENQQWQNRFYIFKWQSTFAIIEKKTLHWTGVND